MNRYILEIADKIKKKGIKVSFLARKAGVNPVWANQFLQGKTMYISMNTIRFFKALGKYVSPEYKHIDMQKFFEGVLEDE